MTGLTSQTGVADVTGQTGQTSLLLGSLSSTKMLPVVSPELPFPGRFTICEYL